MTVHQLTDQEIVELDRAVDDSVLSLPLLAHSRDVALVHLLRFHEWYMAQNSGLPNSGERENATKHGYDGMNHAVQWIFKFCPAVHSIPTLSFDESIFAEAEDLHNEAREYSKVWDLMSMLRRGIIVGFRENDKTIRLTFSSEVNKGMDAAGDLIAGPSKPAVYEGEPIVTPAVAQEILDNVTVQRIEPELHYQVPDRLFNRLAERISRMSIERWEMAPEWDLGGYTIGHLRKFLVTLNTICVIHGQIAYRLGSTKRFLASVIRHHSRSLWERILAKRSRLPSKVVAAILSDLIYDHSLYGPKKKQPHITYQPFLPLGGNVLGVSNWLVHVSNAERNAWDLVSIKRPRLHSTLRNMKEESWIGELRQKITRLGLRAYQTIKFALDGQKSDLDLLILDPALSFGLVCQLKWLTPPGRVANALYNDEEIKKGIKQAQLALAWAQSIPPQLSQHTGLSLEELLQYEFRPLVMCKNTLASGFLRQPGVPVINERLFDWIVGDPHQRDLRMLWQIGEELTYLPKEGKHFETIDVIVKFGGFTFKLEGLASNPKEPWSPVKDIELPTPS